MPTPHLSRRAFLQRTAASAAPCLVPASILRGQLSVGGAIETLNEGWEYVRTPLSGPWEAWSSQPLAPWTKVNVPHCFNGYDGCDPDIPAYRGKGWYRRHIKIANPIAGGRTLLHFEGAGQTSEIYVNDSLAGRHIGGYDEFVVDISSLIGELTAAEKESVRLSVLCDNSPDMERMPSDLSDFTLYGGLYRSVHLVYVPNVSLERVHIRVNAASGKPAIATIEARVYNPGRIADSASVTLSIMDPNGVEVHRTSRHLDLWDGMLELASVALPQPKLWSPTTPQLYRCDVHLSTSSGESAHVERFGIRFYEFIEKGPFLLNGKRLLIQGTHRHEDHAGCAAAMSAPLIRREMQLIKEMGANFIRLAHYQQQRLVLELCDELGLLVWEELPWCRAGVGDIAFRQQGREKLHTMIDQHFNHPSIVLWGLGTEDDWQGEFPTFDKNAIRSYMQELQTLAHQLDDSRLTSFRRCDFARDVPDVYSPSIWAGWYGGRFVDYEKALIEQRDKSRRMLHVEWGADSHARRHAEDPYKTLSSVENGDTAERGMAYLLEGGTPRVSSDGDWSETYACDLFDWHLKVQQRLPWLTGAVQWVFKDFTTPLRSENPVPRVNQKGLVERDMTLKEGYYVFQSYWSEKPMVHIYGHSWPVRWGEANQLRMVKVYSNCLSAELFVNGVSAGIRRRDIQNFPAAGLRWEVPFQSGENKLHVVAISGNGASVSDEVSFVYQTAVWGVSAKLALSVLQHNNAQTTVEATLLDAKGVLCLDARNVVRFSLSGDGRLMDNQGTSSGSRVVQVYNGRAQIDILRGNGASNLAVSCDGLSSAFCSI
jgi:beta-galactosidase